jgi:hypothetical protein
MKNIILIIAVLFMCMQQPLFAQEVFNHPFSYLTNDRPAQDVSSDAAIWWVKPVAAQALVGISRGPDKTFVATLLSGTGIGAARERTILVRGEYYSTFSISTIGFFQPVTADRTWISFSGALMVGVLNGWIAAGPIFNGKEVGAAISSTFNLLK